MNWVLGGEMWSMQRQLQQTLLNINHKRRENYPVSDNSTLQSRSQHFLFADVVARS